MSDRPPASGDGGGNASKPAENTRPSENQTPGDRGQTPNAENQKEQLDRYEQISRDLNPAFRDSSKSRLDPTLHSKESLDMMNSHLDKLASADRNDLPKLGERPSEYDVYKADLVKAVFDKNGKVSPDATNKDILRLVDLNNAEAAAWASRIPAAQKGIRDNATLESFGAGTAPGAAMLALSKAMTHDPAAAAKAVDTVQKSLLKQGLNLTTDLPSGSGPIAPTEKTPDGEVARRYTRQESLNKAIEYGLGFSGTAKPPAESTTPTGDPTKGFKKPVDKVDENKPSPERR